MTDPLARALAARGYDALTPVQVAVGDPAISGRDLLVSAQTGSGKTVGFGLAVAPNILDADGTLPPAGAPLAVVIAPTRELAMQVRAELTWLYAEAGAVLASCVGGMDSREERRALARGTHIAVATPGRLRDHIDRGNIDMSAIRAVVLDEADEMLDLGFAEDLEFILAAAPEERRTLMFSATVPPAIVHLAERFQKDAARIVTATEGRQHADIAYRAYTVAERDAEAATINLLRYHDAAAALVFANTRAAVARLTARLSNRGFRVVSLSGELTQSERSHALQAMRDGRATVCVATDVAARGIDLPGLDLVIHAELPTNGESLLHRSGRTGRAGRSGLSALIVPPKARGRAKRVLQSAGVAAEWTTPPDADAIRARDETRLIEDPLWDAEVTEEEAAFADRLLARQDPRRIAAAYLRLSRQNRAAPEELSDAAAPPPAKARAPFGPATWITLSVGRAERAEARWLLPLLCRAGGMDKSAIGAIRIEDHETRVEIAEGAVAGLRAAAGADGTLEDGVRLIDGAPPPRSTGTAGSTSPAGGKTGPKSQPRPRREPPAPAPPPRADQPAEAPERPTPVDDPATAQRKSPGGTAGKHPGKLGAGETKRSGKPPAAATGHPRKSGATGKPAGPKRPGKPREAPDRSAKGGKRFAAPADGPSKGPRKPHGAAPKAPRADAADTSRRFTPPGGVQRKGGAARPHRKPGKPGKPR